MAIIKIEIPDEKLNSFCEGFLSLHPVEGGETDEVRWIHKCLVDYLFEECRRGMIKLAIKDLVLDDGMVTQAAIKG